MSQLVPDQETPASTEARERLRQLARGNLVAQLIYVAAKLGIADLLRDGP